MPSNKQGVIAGSYQDSGGTSHGLFGPSTVRSPHSIRRDQKAPAPLASAEARLPATISTAARITASCEADTETMARPGPARARARAGTASIPAQADAHPSGCQSGHFEIAKIVPIIAWPVVDRQDQIAGSVRHESWRSCPGQCQVPVPAIMPRSWPNWQFGSVAEPSGPSAPAGEK